MIERYAGELITAMLTGLATTVGYAVVHMRTVGRVHQQLVQIDQDIRDGMRRIDRISRRFHYLSDYAQGLYACVRILAIELKVQLPDLRPYDFAAEIRADDEDKEG